MTSPRYSIHDGSAKPITMPGTARSALESLHTGVHWTTRPLELAAGVGITGPIPRVTEYEDTGSHFFVDPEGKQRDSILDDIALWVHTDRGLVVIVGCSHAGLVNTLRYALRLSGAPRLHAVLGGFHLAAASEARLDHTRDALQELAPAMIIPCHCTGDAAVGKLRRSFGGRVVPGAAGAVFRFGNMPTPRLRVQP